jgi:hypothetical protein
VYWVPIHKDLVPVLKAAGKAGSFSGRVFLTPEGSPLHEDSLKKPWREAVESVGLKPAPRIHDLRQCWKTNAMRFGLHPLMADAIVEEFGGHNTELLFTGKPHTRSSSVPEGTWVYPGSFVDDQREQGVSDQANTLLLCAFSGGSDETRTRDLRRDRPFCGLIVSIGYGKAGVI